MEIKKKVKIYSPIPEKVLKQTVQLAYCTFAIGITSSYIIDMIEARYITELKKKLIRYRNNDRKLIKYHLRKSKKFKKYNTILILQAGV